MANNWADDVRVHAIAVIACVALVYFNALHGPFQFDDYNVIVNNPAVHSWERLWNTMPAIRAVLKATYVTNWLSEWGARGFHVTNVAIHTVNAILVLVLMRRWWPRLATSWSVTKAATAITTTAATTATATTAGAVITALIFALHPAQTEAVTYIAGRSNSLMSTFYLCALWISEPQTKRSEPALGPYLVLVVLVLSLASKEIAWTLPFALMLRDKAVYFMPWRTSARNHWLLFAALAVAAICVVFIPGYWRLLMGSLGARTLGENLLTQIGGIWYLVTRPLLLLSLNIDPSLPEPTQWDVALVFKALVLMTACVCALYARRRYRWFAFGIAWFFLHLLPTNSILPRYDVANDRQLYLALLGPALIASVLITQWTSARTRPFVIAVACLTLGIATIVRNADYASEVSLWQATANKSPDKARVWNNLGYVKQKAGDRDGARNAYDRALAIDPEHVNARINRSTLE